MKKNIFSGAIKYFELNWRDIAIKLFLWILVFIILYIVIKYIVKKIKTKIEWNHLVADSYSKKNSKFVGSMVFVLLMIFNVLVTFEIIWFDTAIIMWWVSLSIWFAMQKTIWNLVSWMFILTNKKFKIWDFVEFLWKLKMRWTIEEINIRYTVVRTYDKKRTIIPNSIIVKTPIKTLKSEPLVKWEVVFKVTLDTPFEIIKTAFKKAVSKNKYLLYPENSSIIIESFWSKWLNVKWFFFCNPAKKIPIAAARDVRKVFIKELKANWVRIPYQYMTISTE